MRKKNQAKTPDLWSDYWRSGQLHACTFDFPEDTRQAIAEKWRDLFAELPSGATILDIATGNGALVSIAAEMAGPDRRLSATGVDLAEIDPQANAGLSASGEFDIGFLGGTDAADLPFKDRQFTLVVSQFGLEYADFEAAVSEACRVADATVMALLHAADGAVVRQNGAIPDQVDWLRGELQLFDVAREHFQNASAHTKQRLDAVATAIRNKCGTLENPDFLISASQYMGQLLDQSASLGEARGLEFLDAMEAQMIGRAERMRALSTAARSEADIALAGDICAAAGYKSVTVSAEYSAGERHLVGYWLRADRATRD